MVRKLADVIVRLLLAIFEKMTKSIYDWRNGNVATIFKLYKRDNSGN